MKLLFGIILKSRYKLKEKLAVAVREALARLLEKPVEHDANVKPRASICLTALTPAFTSDTQRIQEENALTAYS